MAPLGYDTKDRKITVNEAEAERVRTIFRSYLKLGTHNLLMADLRKRGIVSKVRTLKTGEKVGGIPFTRGPLAHLLRNRFYIGEVSFKGEVLKGEQIAIVDRGPGQVGCADQRSQGRQDELRGPTVRPRLRRSRQSDDPEPRPQARHQVPILSVVGEPGARSRD
jgi:Recombinase